MHPLTTDLSKLNDKDLGDKIGELQKKLGLSLRMGNMYLSSQIQMMLEDYQFEYQKRADKQLEELIKKSGKQFKDIINIE